MPYAARCWDHKNLQGTLLKLMLKHTLSQIDSASLTVSDIVNKIDVLLAVRWIKQAWEAIEVQTVVNRFKHCGVHSTTEDSSEVPFADLDEQDDEQEG